MRESQAAFIEEFSDFLRRRGTSPDGIAHALSQVAPFLEQASYQLVPKTALESSLAFDQWTARLKAETSLTLPSKMHAFWKHDKQPGDTPPDFIKRHYRPWLRADGMGLTRPDIKRLDPELYMALANWLRKHELPADCPVPTRSEVVNSIAKHLDDPNHIGHIYAHVHNAMKTRAKREDHSRE